MSAVELPLIEPLGISLTSEQAFLQLCREPHVIFLDSARVHPHLGRYSFVAADPFEFVRIPSGSNDPLAALQKNLARFEAQTVAGIPPFQGGAAGLVSYDLGRSLERLPQPHLDEFQVPALALGLYDVVLAFDHVQGKSWIVSQGFPETEYSRRLKRARRRLDQFRSRLEINSPVQRSLTAGPKLERQSLAPQHEVGGPAGLTSNFSREGYLRAVRRAVEYIYAGDIFQVNLSQRLLYPAHGSSIDLYLRLRERNPATFAGYFGLGDFQVVSASPERFLKLSGGEVEARPIKGTRPRIARPEADLFAGDDLKESEKDRAENVMIVDLLRNDLSRVCLAESVLVTQLCELETYEFVQHLVSAVTGRLRPGLGAVDLLRAAFPGGSITGAPKVRAMEIIAELEPTARGAYCGALGYFGFDGSMDSSILIRTITAGRGWWQLPVGGGIVAQSVPEREYEETWHKAEGLLRSLE